MPAKPFAEAAQQNRDDILTILRHELEQLKTVLEIGSGTGQHAVYFASHMPYLFWQPSDKKAMLPGIKQWVDEAMLSNCANPIELDVNSHWPSEKYDAAYAANIIHIMHQHEIIALFAGLSTVLADNAIFYVYGPFNIQGKYTSEGNRRFDIWLKQNDPDSGIRDRDDLNRVAVKYGFELTQQWDMPSNNKILGWKKT